MFLSFCQRLHSILTVGIWNRLFDRAVFIGDKNYIIQILAHYEKYAISDDLTEAVGDYIQATVNGDAEWTMTVIPSVLYPNSAMFKLDCPESNHYIKLRIRRTV